MPARQAKGLNVHKMIKPAKEGPTLAGGYPYSPGMRVRLESSDELGTVSWVTLNKEDDTWEAVVSWDTRTRGGTNPPRAKQRLEYLLPMV